MSEEILINVTPQETRCAVVENGMLQEVHLERAGRRAYLGNIYMGRVSRVLPGMQAAFIDIGLERAAFLHASDFEPVGDVATDENGTRAVPAIQDLVHEGGDVLVQVIKDPIGTKGARLTTNISLPSRYLVLLPNVDKVAVSARIECEDERNRLRTLVEELSTQEQTGCGYIIRTNAEGVDQEPLLRDLRFLAKLWSSVNEAISSAIARDRVYEDLPLTLRTLRDLMNSSVEKVRIDSHEAHARTLAFARRFIPGWTDRIELYTGERPIFDLYGVEDEIQRALERKAPLKSGGYLIVDQTEAMTTIDVNTGAYVGHRNLEETIYKTNLEAAQAIARQLRLRNLGGIIIIDFIDMTEEEHRRQVMRTLEKSLAGDHAKTQISQISPLGLVEMTRKRTTESLAHQLCEPCAWCNGRGRIKTRETVCYEVFREIVRAVRQFDAEKLLVLAAPVVVEKILDEESAAVAELEEFISKSIRFQPEDQYSQEQYDVVLL